VILIAGPPGVGKTTLAHVVARHAGYNGIEINASDDRSAGVLLQRLEDATGMQSLVPGGRPNCVIMDEIDGVDSKATINTIIQMIERGNKAPADRETKGKKRKRVVPKLKRPIICMCNDQYVPALYQLRHVAQVYTLKDIDINLLTSRLDNICQKEGMKTDRNALVSLAEDSGRDIRSCLNVLQFLRTQGSNRLSKKSLEAVPMLKDATKSLFDIWSEIFFQDAVLKSKGQSIKAPSKTLLQTTGSKFDEIYSLVAYGGDTSKIVDGIFENMLNVKYPDPLLEKTSMVSDWLGHSDLFEKHARSKGDFSLYRYIPAVGVAANLYCNTPNEVRFELPAAQGACRREMEANNNLVSSFLLGLDAESRMSANRSNVVLDYFSPLNKIIHPAIKPGSLLRSEEEKGLVNSLVDTMLRLGLTWKPVQEDYKYSYQLEPAVHKLLEYEESQDVNAVKSTFTDKVKQTLAHEVDLERMRRMDRAMHGKSADSSMTPKSEKESSRLKVKRPTLETPPAVVPVPDSATTKKHVSVMGYLQRKDGNNMQNNDRQGKGDHHPVFFRFQEGFSAAVRRTVYVKDF